MNAGALNVKLEPSPSNGDWGSEDLFQRTLVKRTLGQRNFGTKGPLIRRTFWPDTISKGPSKPKDLWAKGPIVKRTFCQKDLLSEGHFFKSTFC